MMTKAFLRLLACLAVLLPSVGHAESIASMTDPDRDYVLEGDVITVWTDSFLLNDGSGQVIVDVRPFGTRELRIAGRNYVQVIGRVNEDGVLKPLTITRGNNLPVLFQGVAMLEPLPLNEVMKNTVRYRLPRRNTMTQRDADVAQQARNARPAEAPANEAPSYTSTGATPAAAVQPAGAGPAGAAR